MEIDKILEMLSWNNDITIQHLGIEEAKKIEHLSVLFMPIESKLIWENCAKVIASKSNQELQLYLVNMFRWLQDMNWPGAGIIYDRLNAMPSQEIEIEYLISLSLAEKSGDNSWKNVLLDFGRQKGIRGPSKKTGNGSVS